MKRKWKIRGSVRIIMNLTIVLCVLLFALVVNVYIYDKKAGMIAGAYWAGAVFITFLIQFFAKKRVQNEMVRYAANYGNVQTALIQNMEIPYAVLNDEGQLLWGNDRFLKVIGSKKAARRSITNIFAEIDHSKLPASDEPKVVHVQSGEQYYRCSLKLVTGEEEDGEKDGIRLDEIISGRNIIVMTMYEETEIIRLEQLRAAENLVVGLIYIDNYDELIDSIEEARQSLTMALIDRKVNQYMQCIDALSKKLENDKFFFIFKQEYLERLKEKRFSILEDVRSIDTGNNQTVTVSIGIGVGRGTFMERYDWARKAMDLALGRGGDQAVVKQGDKEEFFGGKRTQIERNTRVKARVKAHVLQELIEGKERVVVMGHSIGDVDSFGASIGIYRIAKTLNRRAHVVLNEVTPSVRPIWERFHTNEYEEDMIITGEEAKEFVDENTLLVIVDVNRGSYTECPELIGQARTVVVIDHHRQAGDAIGKAVLFYIEPYASSACEMVAEISEYIGNGLRLTAAEAEAMYAGIMIDTNYFSNKAGVRTFEAMAYLRRNGADAVRVRKLFRENITDYKIKATAIQSAELYLDQFAITESSGGGVESPTVLGAKIANALLDISGVKASFVLTEYKEKIFVSARSIDEMNVQVLMERLGGGGHINMAGTQLKDVNMEEAKEILKKAIDTMIAEEEA